MRSRVLPDAPDTANGARNLGETTTSSHNDDVLGVEGQTATTRRRYEVLRVVNRGGMGEIALGRVLGTKGFEKLVVLKRLRADAEREDHLQMFDVEQEVMSRLEHPNIVKVFDQPIVDNIPYLAMEYVRGRNLDQIIRAAQQRNEPLTARFALSVVSEVLRGLAFVHRLKDSEGRALGVVHQDMTPSNVMVSFFGEVKITDFGISYVTSRDGGLRKGVLKGKPRYVAPEVLAGKRVNNTADIYGVGVVIYELLTGKALFARSSVKETLAAVAKNNLPDFDRHVGEHGAGVVEILKRATRKDPSERYRTAEAMAADVLNELARQGGPLPVATIGYQVRRLFLHDPDVPEMDPELEAAIRRNPEDTSLAPADLDQTIKALDRLLPHDDPSTDLFEFAVPEEIRRHLTDMEDMDPFSAQTPLPDFVWTAKSDDEILERADAAYGVDPLVREAAPLFGEDAARPGDESRGVLNQDPLPEFKLPEAKASPARQPPPARATPPAPQDVRCESPRIEPKTAALPTTTEPPPPAPAAAEPVQTPVVRHAPHQSATRFWFGLVLGTGLGLAVGYFTFG